MLRVNFFVCKTADGRSFLFLIHASQRAARHHVPAPVPALALSFLHHVPAPAPAFLRGHVPRMHRAAPAATALPLSLRVPAHTKPQFVTNVQKTLARVLNLRYYAIQTQI